VPVWHTTRLTTVLEDLSGILQEWGFELSKYDNCVANKINRGKQCAILWHVDDPKISYVEPAVVTMIINQLSECFGNDPQKEARIPGNGVGLLCSGQGLH
jgi:hypothetical protein